MGIFQHFQSLTDKSHRWKLYVLLGVVLYFVAINQLLHVRPDHAFLALFILSLALGGERAKRFLIDWIPFIGFWIAYDMMRGIVDNWRGYIHIRIIYDTEYFLFGWLFNNQIPPFWFQLFQHRIEGTVWKDMLDLLAANLYTFHFGLPIVLGWILWHTYDDRYLYYRYVWTLTIVNIMALITFFTFPSAPPWYVLRYGFDQPTATWLYGTAGALINVDNMIHMKFFTTLWDNFSANNFAAIPSLHGAYPIIISMFTYMKFKKYKVILILYPVITWWAAVYLDHHYIIDLIIGGMYILIAYTIVHKILIPKVFTPLIFEKHRKS